jgi:hypothetical protein
MAVAPLAAYGCHYIVSFSYDEFEGVEIADQVRLRTADKNSRLNPQQVGSAHHRYTLTSTDINFLTLNPTTSIFSPKIGNPHQHH